MKFFSRLFGIGVSLVVIACAQQRGIKGGEKDTTAPKVVQASLDSVSTNFHGTSIAMTFNEWVQIGSASEVVFTPSLKQPPLLKLKGKTVTLSWTDTLQRNTTYQVDFSKAISDVTENNYCSANFVFSTGPDLDSLQIQGIVRDALTGAIPEKAVVLLYSDSLFGKVAYSQSLKNDGSFVFKYLPNAFFKLAVLVDENGNGLWDENEKGAFQSNDVKPNEPQRVTPLKIQTAPQTITCAVPEDFVTDSLGTGFIVRKPGMNKSLRLAETEANRPFRYGALNDITDTLYFALGGEVTNDFVGVRMAYGATCIDTLSSFFSKRAELPEFKFHGRLQKNPDQILLIEAPCYSVLKAGAKAQVSFHGLQAEASIIETGSPLHFAVQLGAEKDELTGEIQVQILPGVFETVYGTSNDTLAFKGSFTPKEKLGSLLLEFEKFGSPYASCFVELRNEKMALVKQAPLSFAAMEFTDLLPGKYFIRVVWDENQNGQWDVNDLESKQVAEYTEIASTPITVKANWQMKVKL